MTNDTSVTRVKEHKEPLFHLVKRPALSIPKTILVYSIAIVCSMILSSIVCCLLAGGQNPLSFFQSLWDGAFKTERKIWLLLQDAALLLGTSVALLPAFKMKFWNLGGNGQILVSGLASIACMFFLGGKISDALLIPIMLVSSIAAGIIWAVIPAIFRAFFNTNESLFTLMMNYIASALVALCIASWVKSGSGKLNPISYGNFPAIVNGYLPIIVVFTLLAVCMFVYLKFSKHGYELTVVGESINTAKYVGINVKKVIIRTMILSGALAGLVGFFNASAVQHTISTDFAGNMGFTAIMTSWLASFQPLVTILSCFFITFVSKGMSQVRRDFKLTNDSLSNLVSGIIYFCIIACAFFINYRIVFRHKKQKEAVNK